MIDVLTGLGLLRSSSKLRSSRSPVLMLRMMPTLRMMPARAAATRARAWIVVWLSMASRLRTRMMPSSEGLHEGSASPLPFAEAAV